MAASLAKATAKATVTLTVRKQAGSQWRKYATSKVVLAEVTRSSASVDCR